MGNWWTDSRQDRSIREMEDQVASLHRSLSRQRSDVVDPRRRQVTLGLAIVGVVLCLAVIGWPNGLAILAVLAGLGLLIGSGVRAFVDRDAHARELERQEAEIVQVKRSADEAASTLADVERQIGQRREQATADLAVIRTHIAA